MSLILDALRRRSGGREYDDPAGQTARTDRVLATLGYGPRDASGRLTLKALLVYAGLAVALGFVGLWVLVSVFSPSTAQRPPVQRTVSAPPPSATVPSTPITAPPGPETPRPEPARPVSALPPPPTAGTANRPAPKAPETPVTPTPPRRPPAQPEPPTVAPRPSTSSGRGQPAEPREPEAPTVSTPALGPAPAPADHFGLALYYQRIGDFDHALAQYRVLLAENDSSVEVHNNVGLVYRERGQLDEAIKEFQRAIEIDPKYVRAHNNLGVALMGLPGSNRLDAAGAEFRVALAADPRNVESIVNLALVQKAAGRSADARDLLLRAVGIDARSPGVHYNLAVVADETGDVSMAVEHYRAFLRLGAVTYADLLARVRARLAALGSG